MSYRYVGDPNRRLPEPRMATWDDADSEEGLLCRVFETAALNIDVFEFAIDEVLLRAAKRRNSQGRLNISVTDMIAGFVRKGELTRCVLRRLQIDPDGIYDSLAAAHEDGPQTPGAMKGRDQAMEATDLNASADLELELAELLAQWIVREEAQFDPMVVGLLIAADEHALKHPNDRANGLIPEQEVLLLLIETDGWRGAASTGLPPATIVRQELDRIRETAELDANGCLVLDGLDPSAQGVIEVAHLLSQQRGASPIPHRLFLAAFLQDADGSASRLCKVRGVEAIWVYQMMLAITPDEPPRFFPLGFEACERIVLPTMRVARKLADAGCVTGDHLFRAFCQVADIEFKRMLAGAHMGLPLDAASLPLAPTVGTLEAASNPTTHVAAVAAALPHRSDTTTGPASPRISGLQMAELTGAACKALQAAAVLARESGWTEIRSPHLFAALCDSSSDVASGMLREAGVSTDDLKRIMLSIAHAHSSEGLVSSEVVASANTLGIIANAIRNANAKHRTHATELDLIEAILADSMGIVSRLLGQAGLHLSVPTATNDRTPSSIH